MEHDENLPVAIPLDDFDGDEEIPFEDIDGENVHVHPAFARHELLQGRNLDNSSSYLDDMIREDCTCTSILSGWSPQVKGCRRIVEHCSNFPDDAFYKCPRTGRTPLHEGCLRCSCVHVINAILAVNTCLAMVLDNAGNTPLHLLFVGVSTHALDPEQMDGIVSELLSPNPTFIASISNREGLTALHMACLAPETMIHPQSVQKILAANPSCASRLSNANQTALTLHCKRRNASTTVAKMLLDAHLDSIHIVDSAEGWTPLHYAAANANQDVISLLVKYDPEAARTRTTTNQKTALHILCQQNPADRHLPAFQALLEAEREAVIMRDSVNAYTPLHAVCRGSRISLEVVKSLVETMPEVASIPDQNSYLPLHHACEIGADPQVISYLVSAYPAGSQATTKKNDSALSLACACNKSVDTVQILIEANPDALTKQNDYGFVPLHCACRAYQPRMGIVQALLDSCPSSVAIRSHGGETPVHLACSNVGTFVGVIELLTLAFEKAGDVDKTRDMVKGAEMTNKVGNTPLHYACFRGSPFEHIETLAVSNPEWILIRNNAGYSPLQIMCKNGRIDQHIITTFSRISGPGIFSVVDQTGNTALHSAMREETDVEALRSLIRAFPEALHWKTAYGDTPLHLACFRRLHPDVVREVALASSDALGVALASCNGRVSPIMIPNTAGQTPIGIAMEEFQTVCRSSRCCSVKSEYRGEQTRAFEVLATLVKILHYRPTHQDDCDRTGSLVRACVSLHRRDVRLDPAFIRRALHLFPEEVRKMDEHGNYPLHIEASIPVEKMSLLNASFEGCCTGNCHKRMGILRMLMEIFPEASTCRNVSGEFPLTLMIQNGRQWDQTFALVLRTFPQALHWSISVNSKLLPKIFEKIAKECGPDVLFTLISSRPDIVRRS